MSAYFINGNMTRRELYTIRINPEDADRYRAWCGVLGIQMADGIGVLMNAAKVPTLEEMQNFVKKDIKTPFDGE